MKILIIGSGGREHALTWRLWKSADVTELIAMPGNPGIEAMATCIPGMADIRGYASFAEQSGIDLTIVGPEAPLVHGIVDEFRTRGLQIIGPTKAAAQLEGSKIFAKKFFQRAGIPTARSVETTSTEDALRCLQEFPLPVVIKADGLAGGKGVIIANTMEDAESAIQKLGKNLVIEEFLEGEEVSFIGLSDGSNFFPFSPSQDHKRIFDGDAGPNTGGMGAYADTRILSAKQSGQVMDKIMLPALAQMNKEGTPFTGFLYAGLMMTAAGPRLLEFNVRLGDPEAQALLHSMEGDLATFLVSPAEVKVQFPSPSVCIVLAAQGYPDAPKTGDVISGIKEAEAAGAVVFQAGTKREDGHLVTHGGRVLGVTASGEDLRTAVDRAYAAAAKISFNGMQFRTDIGAKGLRR
ncbi:MAG TPA: phosphoribosylamine--glycine ligase [Bryobacteraceae bacterium]|nr:phosphoribosylamine--glycine ligase [Bryobacteraceae bacterium]